MRRLLPIVTIMFGLTLTACQDKNAGHNRQVQKTAEEVCVEHRCTHKDCPMQITANLKPGEKIICPVCGEYITVETGKLVEKPDPTKKPKIVFYRNPMDPQVTSPVPMKDQMGMDYVPVYEGEESTGSTLKISPEKQQLMGVTTAPVKKVALKKIIRASGKIAYDPELFVTQEEFIQALDNEDRVKDSPLQEIIDRAKSLTDAARRKLKLSGMDDEQISRLEQIRKVDSTLYLPGKGENVWAYLNIYEYEIGDVKTGMAVEVEAPAYPGIVFKGIVASLNPVLDPATRTNQVRVNVSNPDDKLKPEMYVNAKINVDVGERLAVPESAVMDTGIRKMVYISKAENMLEAREVKLGQRVQGYYEVLEGLNEGDVVVISGNFLIDSESRLQAPAAGGHQHP